MLLGIITCFGPALVISVVYGCMPPVSASMLAKADVRKSYIFDAHQLAECLGITVRSVRRIMNKIMEAGYGKVYAKKTAAAGGRPKALVEILFKIHCKWSFIRTRVDEQ